MLVDNTVEGFLTEVASNSAAPGGGSVAALSGALGAGLTAMVCRLTIGKKKYVDVQQEMESVLNEAEELRTAFTALIDEDTEAFNGVMAAFSLPKETDQEKLARSVAIQEATKSAARVPLKVMELCERAIPLAMVVATKGNVNSISDSGVAATMIHSACLGAALNVRINLGTIQDEEFLQTTSASVSKILSYVESSSQEILAHVQAAIQ
jgi:formiminotetrahydrofolate cyclodeaminase